MTFSRLKYVALILIAMLVMSLLYNKTQAVDLDKHNQLLKQISQFNREDAVLNQHILEIRLNLLSYYDLTVSNISVLLHLQTEIEAVLATLPLRDSATINKRLTAINDVLLQKQELLETFKSSNAVLHNSLYYLPVAVSQLSAQLPAGEHASKLKLLLNALLRDTLIYSLTGNSMLLTQLDTTSKTLNADFSRHAPQLHEQLKALLPHVDIIRESKNTTDTLVQQILELPIQPRMNELLAAYSKNYRQIQQESDIYRWALYIFSLILLIVIAFIWLRLNRAAADLRRSVAELNYQKFAMDEHAIVSISDKNGIITYTNQKFCDINHRASDELIGQNHQTLNSAYHPDAFFEELWRTISQGTVWHGQIKNRTKHGNDYWVETTIVPFVDDHGVPYQYAAISTDITEIKEAEEKLHLQSAALKVAANGIVITDQKGKILWVNDAFSKLTGYSRQEVVRQTPRMFKSENQEPVFYQNMWQTILAGNVWRGELINRRKDGSLYREEQAISPVFDDQGRISHFIAIKQDVTERAELEEALRRSQKMEAIGQLSGGIAHDFNNQLGVIVGYLDFLHDYTANDEKPHKWVATATRATMRCIDLTRQLLAFSRKESKIKSVVNLNTTLDELKTMITRSVTPEVEVQTLLANDLWLTEIDPGEFQDVILNLVINARDAMPDGGQLFIETSNKYLDDDYSALNPETSTGDYVQLMISDTGTGMSKEIQDRIFEPFYTTKTKGKGTGLGMSMVYGFLKRFNGTINITSEVDIGTTMQLYLPRSESSEADAPVKNNHAEAAPRGNESVLIVDDETDLLHLADKYLTNLGYHTYLAENANQALDILSTRTDIGLLFSDIVMPGGINGYELAQKASEKNPRLRILLTSGFTSKAITHDGQALYSAQLINKPYRMIDLAKTIRLVLDKEAG